MEEAIDPVSYC